jgi:uncharacterized delta-60 repeat protein
MRQHSRIHHNGTTFVSINSSLDLCSVTPFELTLRHPQFLNRSTMTEDVRKMSVIKKTFCFALLCAATAHASPGDRDVSYGNQGGMTIAIPGYQKAWAYRGFLQADGKLVAVGFVQSSLADDQDTLVMRFNQDGSPDESFGAAQSTPGVVILDSMNFGYNDVAWGGVQQPDGSLVIVGATGISVGGFPGSVNVLRLLPNGQLDAGFGIGGRANLPFGLSGTAVDAFVEPNGALTVAGNLAVDFGLIRLTSAGAIDIASGFGVNGIARIPMLPFGSAYANRVIKQLDGKYVAAGRVALAVNGVVNIHFAAARFQSNGQIDMGFNASGRVVNPCEFQCFWNGVAEQADGKLVFVGSNQSAAIGVPSMRQDISHIARLNVDGSVDVSFGNAGLLTRALHAAAPTFQSAGDLGYDLSIDPDNGAITVLGALTSRMYNPTGTASVQAFYANVLTRFLPSGQVDTAFGQRGSSVITHGVGPAPIPTNVVIPRNLSRQADGRLVVVSLAGEYINAQPQAQAIYVARVLAAGSNPGVVSGSTAGQVTERSGQALVRVFRHGGAAGPVAVSYSTVSATATADDDFTPVSGVLTWDDGDDSIKLISIPIVADDVLEAADETFSLAFSTVTPGVSVLTSDFVLTIARDDTVAAEIGFDQALVTANESASSVMLSVNRVGGTNAVSVAYYTVPLNATAGADFVRTSGSVLWSAGDTTSKEVIIPLLDDATHEGTQSFAVVLTAPGGSPTFGVASALVAIGDDDAPPHIVLTPVAQTVAENGGTVAFEATLVGETAATVSVSYATANGSATAGADYAAAAGVLTWAPGDPVTQTIVVPLLDDVVYEGSNEAFSLSLANPSSGAVLNESEATVTLADNDVAPQLGFTIERVKVNERDSTAEVTVSRNGASALAHSVDFVTRNGTARAGRDYVAVSGTLTWLATDSDTKTITVPIIRKPRREDNERFFVDLSNATGGASLGLAECKVVITERPR